MPRPLKIKRKKKIRSIYSTVCWTNRETGVVQYKEAHIFTVSNSEWGYTLLEEGSVNITHIPSGLALHYLHYDCEENDGGFFQSAEKQKRIKDAEDIIRKLDDRIFPPFLENHYTLYFLEKGVFNVFPEPNRRMKHLNPVFQIWREQVQSCLIDLKLQYVSTTPTQWDDDIPF